MNTLMLFAVLLLVTQAPVPIPRQAANAHTQKDGSIKADSQDQNNSASEPSLAGEPVKPQSNQSHANGNAAKENPRVVSISKLPPIAMESHAFSWSDWTLLVFNGLLVLVGGTQALYVARTLRSIGRQADHMAEQTRIQRGGMKQWVSLDDCQSKDEWPYEGPTLEVSFTLTNPTNFLIVLNHVEVSFSPRLPTRYILATNGTLLPPNKPLSVNLSIPLDTVRLGTFRTSTLGLGVEGTIKFTGALEEEITQQISGLLSCNSVESTFESTVKFRPTEKKD